MSRFLIALCLVLACCGDLQRDGSTQDLPPIWTALPGDPAIDATTRDRLQAALHAKGDDYVPRTHHLRDDGTPIYVNRLILQTSPYLLQHAHNPVDWYAWSPEAFERAKAENKPVFLSIGYSTCHWCHVMERESFEDEAIAAYLNQNYIAIKVDREERPDIDDLYMAAVVGLTGQGGWPMTVVMTPDKEPFFGGTYFPPEDGSYGRIGFRTVLSRLHDAWVNEPDKVVASAKEISDFLRKRAQPAPGAGVPTATVLHAARAYFEQQFDPDWGGFGSAPKFPTPSQMVFLFRYDRRAPNQDVAEMGLFTLRKMAEGGIHDQLGGGFHRYSVDGEWLVPHFEKMLYDQGQLATLYLEAAQISGDPFYADVARDLLTYVAREMAAPEGGLHSATDADSPTPSGHQEEGWFFTWTPDEVHAVVPDHADAVLAYWGIRPGGNFEGRSILHTPRSKEVVAKELGITVEVLQDHIDSARGPLYDRRATRPAPLKDDKVVTAWNGLMISAFARAALVLDEPRWAEQARTTAAFLLDHTRTPDGRLHRTWRAGVASHPAILDDYAFLIQGLLDLHEATGETRWLEVALQLQSDQDTHFAAEGGGYYLTADDGEALLTRDRPSRDGAEPSGNSVSALNLLRLSELTSDPAHRTRAEQLFSSFSVQLHRSGPNSPYLLAALDYYLDAPREVVIVGTAAEARPLLDVVRKTYLPNRVLIAVEPAEARAQEGLVPLLTAKDRIGGLATAYVCERGLCEAPTSDPAVFAAQLAKVVPYPG